MSITATGLGMQFPGTAFLFRQLSFVWEPGDFVAVTGPSGCGKSTLLSILSGWLVPTEGTLVRPDRISLAWVFQNPHGVPKRTTLDHVVLPLLARGISRGQADVQAAEILDRFAIAHLAQKPYSTLSGGEGQRLMLARAVAKHPNLLLVDEPTAQLDTQTAASVNAVLGELANDETIVVVATHDADTAAAGTRHLELRDYGG